MQALDLGGIFQRSECRGIMVRLVLNPEGILGEDTLFTLVKISNSSVTHVYLFLIWSFQILE